MKFLRKLKQCVIGFVADEALQSAAAISFYALLALPPLIVLMVSVAGLMISDSSFQAYLIAQAGQLFGPSGSEIVAMIIVQSNLSRHGIAAVVGLIVLIVTSGGLHSQLQAALNKMWNLKRRKRGAVIRFLIDRLIASVTVALTGVVLIVSLFLDTALRAASNWLNAKIHMDVLSFSRTQDVGTFLLLTALVALLYHMLPDAKIDWRDVMRGAFITSFLFTITRYFFAMYLARTTLTVSYGQAGTLVLLLLWVYFSALIFLFVAEWVSIGAEERGRKIVAKDLPLGKALISKLDEYPGASVTKLTGGLQDLDS
jgi:membrane protein